MSLTLKRVRSVGLLGRDGAGKPMLLRLFAGTIRLDSGRIVREGHISWPLELQGSFQPNLAGEQNVRFVARVYGVDSERRIDYVADLAELGAFFRAATGHNRRDQQNSLNEKGPGTQVPGPFSYLFYAVRSGSEHPVDCRDDEHGQQRR